MQMSEPRWGVMRGAMLLVAVADAAAGVAVTLSRRDLPAAVTVDFPVWEPNNKAEPCSPSNPCFAVSTSRELGNASPRDLVAVMLFASAVCHCVPVLTHRLFNDVYKAAVRRGLQPWRWVQAGLSGSLVTATLALLVGETDVFVLTALCALSAGSAALSYASDYIGMLHVQLQEWTRAGKWGAHAAAWGTHGVVWLALVGKVALSRGESAHLPMEVVWLVGAECGLWLLGMVVHMVAMARSSHGAALELTHLLIGAIARGAVVLILFVSDIFR